MSTYLELQNRVKNAVIDLPTTVSAEVPNLINDAIRSVQRSYNFRAMEQSTTLVTVSGSLSPSPNTLTNFKEYKDKGPYLQRTLQKAKREVVTDADDAALAALADPLNPSEPGFLINSVDQATGIWTFTVYPYPDLLSDWPDGNYRLVIPYYAYSTPLANNGDVNWFTLNMDDYIYREATAQAFALDWDYQSMAVWQQLGEVKRKEAIKADKMNRLGAVDALVPHWEGANQARIIR